MILIIDTEYMYWKSCLRPYIR